MSNGKIKLKIISPERIVFDEEVDSLVTQGTNGQFGILPDHVPFMTPIEIGVTKVIQNGVEDYIATMGGTFQVKDNMAVILTNCAERSNEIDIVRAKAAKERAEAKLAQNSTDIDSVRANIAIAKALARLKAAMSKK